MPSPTSCGSTVVENEKYQLRFFRLLNFSECLIVKKLILKKTCIRVVKEIEKSGSCII